METVFKFVPLKHTTVSAQITKDTKAWLLERAKKDRRSVSSLVNIILEEYVERVSVEDEK